MSEIRTQQMPRVGELARTAGLTVRTLHHYEQIGILTATARTSSGHRVYGPEAVARLYQLMRLRSLGMPLEQIRRALDDPHFDLSGALRSHLVAVEHQLKALVAVRDSVVAVLAAQLDPSEDPLAELMEVLSTMTDLSRSLHRRISIMVYRDPGAAHQFLTDVFGFSPGEVTIDENGRAVHAEVTAGDGVIWLHPENKDFKLSSPLTVGAATASMAVLVDDVDEHHAMVKAKHGDIVYAPVDQPYGYREYSVRDHEGSLWSFMKEIDR